jgi:hypothetical protein
MERCNSEAVLSNDEIKGMIGKLALCVSKSYIRDSITEEN